MFILSSFNRVQTMKEIIPPKLIYLGSDSAEKKYKGQALSFWNFIEKQPLNANLSVTRSTRLNDGTILTATVRETAFHRCGEVLITPVLKNEEAKEPPNGFLYHPVVDMGGYMDIPYSVKTGHPQVDFLLMDKNGYVKTGPDVFYTSNGIDFYPQIAKKNGWSNGKSPVLSGDYYQLFKYGRPFINARTMLAFLFKGFLCVVSEGTPNVVYVFGGKTLLDTITIGSGAIVRASANKDGSKLIVKTNYAAAAPFSTAHPYSATLPNWEAYEEYSLSINLSGNVVLTLDTRTEQYPHLVFEVDWQFLFSESGSPVSRDYVADKSFDALVTVLNNVSAITEMYFDDDNVKQTHVRSAYTLAFNSVYSFSSTLFPAPPPYFGYPAPGNSTWFYVTDNTYNADFSLSFAETLAHGQTGSYSFSATKSWSQNTVAVPTADPDYVNYEQNIVSFDESVDVLNYSTGYDKTGKIFIYDDFSESRTAAYSSTDPAPYYHDNIAGTKTRSYAISDSKSGGLGLGLKDSEVSGTETLAARSFNRLNYTSSDSLLGLTLDPSSNGGEFLFPGNYMCRYYQATDNNSTNSKNSLFVGVTTAGRLAEDSYLYSGQLFDHFLYDKYWNILYQYQEPRGGGAFVDHFKLFKKAFEPATQPPANPPYVACDDSSVMGAK